MVATGSKAQLITDSDARLKTVKVEKEGFLAFQKKKKRFDTAPKDRKVGKAKDIRYSQGSPFRAKTVKVKPRFTVKVPFEKWQYRVKPRFTEEQPFGSEIVRLKPRYSQPVKWPKKEYAVAPRYSKGQPFGNEIVRLKPRYSEPVKFPKWQFKVNPRYSPGSPWEKEKFKVNPRYSIAKDFSLKRMWILRNEPLIPMHPTIRRYKGPFADKPIKPGSGRKLEYKSFYEGPSWTIFAWGNKSGEGDVDGTISKPKFDRKEREIWNN